MITYIIDRKGIVNWYKVIKIADASTKIRKLGITSPLMQAIIYRYENVLPWNGISNQEDFSDMIGQEVNKIPEQIRNISDEVSVVFEKWLNYISYSLRFIYDKEGYGEDKERFINFLFFKSLYSFAKSKKYLPKPDYRILSDMFGQIESNPKQVFNIMSEFIQRTKNDQPDGWHKFEGGYKRQDPEELKSHRAKEAERLSDFVKGSGWCIADFKTALQYLSRGALYLRSDVDIQSVFEILVENKKPVIAVYMFETKEKDDPTNTKFSYSGIYGPFNEMPSPEYYPVVKDKLYGLGIDADQLTSDREISFMRSFHNAMKDFAKTENMEEKNTIITNLLYNDGLDAIEKLDNNIIENPELWETIKEHLLKMVSRGGDIWKKIPANIKNKLPKDSVANALSMRISNGSFVDIDNFPIDIVSRIPADQLYKNLLYSLHFHNISIENISDDYLGLIPKEMYAKKFADMLFERMKFVPIEKLKNSLKSDILKSIADSPEYRKRRENFISRSLSASPKAMEFIFIEERPYWINKKRDAFKKYVLRVLNKALDGLQSNFKTGFPLRDLIDGLKEENPNITSDEEALKMIVDDDMVDTYTLYLKGRHMWSIEIATPTEMESEFQQIVSDFINQNIVAKVLLPERKIRYETV